MAAKHNIVRRLYGYKFGSTICRKRKKERRKEGKKERKNERKKLRKKEDHWNNFNETATKSH